MSDVKQVQPVRPPYRFEDCVQLIRHISEENGGGYLVTFPDLPGGMADGESVEESLRNARHAFESTIAAMVDMGIDIPAPTFKPDAVAALSSRASSSRACPRASMHSSNAARALKGCH